jgi:hypothetical protein
MNSNAIALLPHESQLRLPKTKADYDAAQSDELPKTNKDEIVIYEQLGLLMMYCYDSSMQPQKNWVKVCSTGRHFYDTLFKAALCLTGKEIDTPFSNLTLMTKLKMFNALVNGVKDWDFKASNKLIGYLNEPSLTKAEQDEAIDYLEGVTAEDLSQLRNNEATLRQELLAQLAGVSEAGALAPIHAIAKGLRSLHNRSPDHWNSNFHAHNIKYVEFSARIQGSIKRQDVANSFVIDGVPQGTSHYLEINKKVTFLKEWICDTTPQGATEEEIANLLKFCTGSSGLPVGRSIKVRRQVKFGNQSYSPCPKVHTCSLVAEFSPEPVQFGPGGVIPCQEKDNTREAFIAVLRKWALSDPNSYQNS